ncbi:hypothetical protein CORT_0D05110 [Candida orthopsilosis Co 90-125]|uniref:SET domain-containing protein n=1 Tax=Candida orthopsilosis (strain 90-125) TaxID=1136231 RepID=H8X6A3_CANO9|nr:hypothetical protein CORT_0D05110 [Candida orthopsilosis Co 90-125]CCG23351.1 hypothetical protein CORT_0D05110 [Candida orthopsilosis Co 90-125]
MSQLTTLDKFNIAKIQMETSKNKDSPEYWKFRLAIKLIQDIYMFPSDESCKREFYDTVSNDKMRVMGREFIPGERSVVANVDFTIGSHIMDVSTVAVLFDDYGDSPPVYITRYQEIFQSMLIATRTNKEINRIILLTFLVMFNYLEDSEFASKVNNLCTHQRQIRFASDVRNFRDSIKSQMIDLFHSYFKAYSLAMEFFKKGQIKMAKSSWKFLENLINVVMVNHSVLMNHHHERIGIFLDPQFAIFNHSCLPNCLQIESGYKQYSVVNSLPIQVNEEITVNYIDVSTPVEIRVYKLFTKYHFHCQCQLCSMKQDVFFTMQCNECLKQIKSSSLTSVLTTPNTILKEQSCSKCFHPFDLDVYTRQIQIRNFFIALILIPKSNYNINDEGYFSLLLKEFSGLIERNGATSLVKLLVKSLETFQIVPTRVSFIKHLIDEVMTTKVFALYTFPFNVIVQKISNDTCECNDFDTGLESLKYYARVLFAVKFPADLSSQLFFDECVFLDLAYRIEKLMSVLVEEQADTFFGTFEESMELFARCAYFFYKHVKCKFEIENVEEKLLQLRQGYHPVKSKRSIHSCLERLFSYANANIFITKTRFLIFNARQEQVTLFHTFDSDDYM